MSADIRHVRHEPKTRALLGLEGSGKELPDGARQVTWCGRTVQGWIFGDASHVVLALQQQTGIQPCKDCLKAIRAVIQREIDGKTFVEEL